MRAARGCQLELWSQAGGPARQAYPNAELPLLAIAVDHLDLEVDADSRCGRNRCLSQPTSARANRPSGEGVGSPEVSSGPRKVSSVKRSKRDDFPTEDAPAVISERVSQRTLEGLLVCALRRVGRVLRHAPTAQPPPLGPSPVNASPGCAAGCTHAPLNGSSL